VRTNRLGRVERHAEVVQVQDTSRPASPAGRRRQLRQSGIGQPGHRTRPCKKDWGATPNKAPTPAVNAMANAPQKVTRTAAVVTEAPPARAAREP